MRAWSPTVLVVLTAPLMAACGGDGDGSPDSRRPAVKRAPPEATIARWVREGDCGLMTDRYVGFGYRTPAAGRRVCQVEADKTPVEPYRVASTRANGRDAHVVLALEGGKTYTFWLVARGKRGWAIDGYEERRPGDGTVAATQVIAAFERRTGERLDRLGEASTPDYQTFSLRGLDEFPSRPARALLERFGAFDIFVAADAAVAKRIFRGGSPDERGIRWQGSTKSPVWQARKRFANVVLSWASGSGRRTDRRFDLLVGILRRAARSTRG